MTEINNDISFDHDYKLHDYFNTPQEKKNKWFFRFFCCISLCYCAITLFIFIQYGRFPYPFDLNHVFFFLATVTLGFFYQRFNRIIVPTRCPLLLPNYNNGKRQIQLSSLRSTIGPLLFAIAYVLYICVIGYHIVHQDCGFTYTEIFNPLLWHYKLAYPKALLFIILLHTCTIMCLIVPFWGRATTVTMNAEKLIIRYDFIFIPKVVTVINSPWEEISYVTFEQGLRNTSYIMKKSSQGLPFTFPRSIFLDPCWLSFIARTLAKIDASNQREQFLAQLSKYVPHGAKVEYSRGNS